MKTNYKYYDDRDGKTHHVYRVQYYLYDSTGTLYKKFKQQGRAALELDWYNSNAGVAGFNTPAKLITK